MRTTELIHCCGAVVFSEFGNTNTAITQTKFTPEEVEKFLVEKEATYRKFGKSLAIATLNGDQKAILGPTFKKLGWRTASKSYHPNHKTDIYLLTKKLQTQK